MRQYWAIVEIHNGMFNCVYAPYDSQEEADIHRDKLKAFRKANPVPVDIKYTLTKVYHPSYVG